MGSPIIPTLRYRDARRAIDFLCDAFGFERHMVVEGEGDEIEHAQLTLSGEGVGGSGAAMIMLGSAGDDAFDALQKPPAEAGAAVSQSPYIVISDVAAHCARARAAGAEIVMEPEEQDYGGSLYSCRDPEGYLWNFGSYDPWAPADAAHKSG